MLTGRHKEDYDRFNSLYLAISNVARPFIDGLIARDYNLKNEDYRARAKIRSYCNIILIKLNMISQNLKDFIRLDSDWYEEYFVDVQADNEQLVADLNEIEQTYETLKQCV